MNQIDLKIRNTLEYIKANPKCNTNPDCLDGHLVEDLHNKGFIIGIKVTDLQSTSPEYIDLYINSDGEKYFNKLENNITKTKPTQYPINKKEDNKNSDWHNKPTGKIIIGTIIGIILIIIGLIINHFL